MACKRGGVKEETEEDGGKKMRGVDHQFNMLPEGCVAAAISFTAPRDACRLAAVSKLFKSAAYSDDVWFQFLPSDYRQIVSRSEGGDAELSILESGSLKDAYFHLAHHPLLLDGSKLEKCENMKDASNELILTDEESFLLDKSTGKKCFTICARELSISWGDTPRYWSFHSLPESRFPEVAELNSVSWLEIKGKMKASILSPDTAYAAYLIFRMAETAYGFYSPAEVTVKVPGGKSETRNVYLQYGDQQRRTAPRRRILLSGFQAPILEAPPPNEMLPRERGDGWLEVEIGDLFTQVGGDGEIEMSVREVAGNWKSGLIVEGIEVRPKVALK